MVAICNCRQCQKRTGSAFSVSAYFDNPNVLAKNGHTKIVELAGDSGGKNRFSVCTECGTSVYWSAQYLPGKTGVAGGCFKDPSFPEPQVVAWASAKKTWTVFPENLPILDKQGSQ